MSICSAKPLDSDQVTMAYIRKNWIKHGKILSLVKINSAKTQLTQFSLSCCQRADFSVLSQKRWDKLGLFYKHNTNPNENSQFKHWFYIRSYRVKLNSFVIFLKKKLGVDHWNGNFRSKTNLSHPKVIMLAIKIMYFVYKPS